MENEEGTVVEMTATKQRRAATRKPAGAARPRKTTTRRRTAARKKAVGHTSSFESVIESITGSVGVARAAIAEASGQGTAAVRSALGTASTASRKTITRLARDWKAMDPRKKARVLAALLGAAAAVSAPLVRKRLKK